jgi:hypothetical protein
MDYTARYWQAAAIRLACRSGDAVPRASLLFFTDEQEGETVPSREQAMGRVNVDLMGAVRRPIPVVFTLALGLVLGLAAEARAGGLCVQVDGRRDNLSEEDRHAARMLLIQAFEVEGVVTDIEGFACSETYFVANVKLGSAINVTVTGPAGSRQARATSLDELSLVYSQIVKALLTGQPIATGGAAVDRNNVTTDQMAPRRAAADSLKYVRIGYGTVAGDGLHSGPSFGFGYRYELDTFGVEASIFNFLLRTDSEGAGAGVSASWIKLMGLYFFQPVAAESSYLGLGTSWGGTAVEINGSTYSGGGLQGELSLGFEMLRASTIRMFVQLDVTLPLYMSDNSAGAERYTPAAVVSVGGGFGRSHTVRVVH